MIKIYLRSDHIETESGAVITADPEIVTAARDDQRAAPGLLPAMRAHGLRPAVGEGVALVVREGALSELLPLRAPR